MNAIAKKPGTEAGNSEDFGKLLEEYYGKDSSFGEGHVVKGTIVSIGKEFALVDVGAKTEGRVPLSEFGQRAKENLNINDIIDVYIERLDDKNGETKLSRELARREEIWEDLEKAYTKQDRVDGTIFRKVKGGYTVDVQGINAFLPNSQVDFRPIRDASELMNKPQPFQILKMDRARGNIVVSRKAVLQDDRAEILSERMGKIEEGQVLKGIVKNITDYGAFIDLGGVDGLLHVTDISWQRINHPSEVLSLGEAVEVKIIRFDDKTQRISLGMKQLNDDPWKQVAAKYTTKTKVKGKITNIADYGAFVELEPGVEGLIHVSEMSWTKKNIHPNKVVTLGAEVEVMVLDIDADQRRISLGLKQCQDNPWSNLAEKFPVGTEVENKIKNITEFGLFVALTDDIDGMVHLSDLSWETSGEEAIKEYKKGDTVKVKVLDIDSDEQRISLGIKQLGKDPFDDMGDKLKKGTIVTCTIVAIQQDKGIEVEIEGGVRSFIRKSDLSRDRSEQRTDRFAQGEKIDAKITNFEGKTRKVTLSIKAKELDDEKQAMADFGSADSGARLGDILGAALNAKKTPTAKADDTAEKAEKKPAKKPAKKKAAKKEEPETAEEPKAE